MFLHSLESICVSAFLGREAAAQYAAGDVARRFLAPVAQAVVALSENFTRERERFDGDYWRDPTRLAYLLYFMPRNLEKAWRIMGELAAHPEYGKKLASRTDFAVLDVGCGCGAAALATLGFLAECRAGEPFVLRVGLVDQSAAAVRDAAQLLKLAAAELAAQGQPVVLDIHTHVGDVAASMHYPDFGTADFIWFANVVNEVVLIKSSVPEANAAWVKRILDRFLASDGTAFLLEPALHNVARDLMALRDAMLVADSGVNVFAPCVADGPCRMLTDCPERDWCHVGFVWSPPPLVAQLDELTKLNSRLLNFAWLALRRDGLRASDARGERDAWRVVGDRIREKGREKMLACGDAQCGPLVRLKRDRSDANDVFHDLRRGDLVYAGPPLAIRSGEARVEAETVLERQPMNG